MPVIPILHRRSEVRSTIRRGFRGTGARVIACKSWERLHAHATEAVVDAVVVEIRREHSRPVARWTKDFPAIPVFGFSTLRPDDGSLIQAFWDAGVTDLIVGGVEDSVAGGIVAANTVVNRIRTELADAPRLFRLTEQVQLRVWGEVLERVDQELRTATIAQVMDMSREHLSREFAAGGAPNLKRVIDFAKVAVAARLLDNPGYSYTAVSRILGFATPSHLATCADRVAGVKTASLAELGPRGVLNRFRRGRTRSRL